MDCGLKGLTFTDPSLTRQEFAGECSIQFIVRQFLKTGVLPNTVSRPSYDSDEGLPVDYQELQDRFVQARELFDQLPLEERNRFNNDPETWVMSFGSASQPSDTQPSDTQSSDTQSAVTQPVDTPPVEVK